MKISTSITIEESIIEKVDEKAEQENRNRSNMIEVLLKKALQTENKEQA